MTEKQDIARREDSARRAEAQIVQTSERETVYVPDVDIREDSECIRLEANMPGVDQESAAVSVENGVLTIEGRARSDVPHGCTLAGQEYGVGKYRRDFSLSDAVDAEGIKARVRHGVLEVTLPRHERVTTKKIKIET